jgi:hypothetical protein
MTGEIAASVRLANRASARGWLGVARRPGFVLCRRLTNFAEAPAYSAKQQRTISRASRRTTAQIRGMKIVLGELLSGRDRTVG